LILLSNRSSNPLENPGQSLPPPGLGNVLLCLLGRDFIDSGYEVHLVNTDDFGLLPELVAEVDDGEQDLWKVVRDEIGRKVLGLGVLDCLVSVDQFLIKKHASLKRIASSCEFLLTDIPSEEQKDDRDEGDGVVGSETSVVELGVVRKRFPVKALRLHSLGLQNARIGTRLAR